MMTTVSNGIGRTYCRQESYTVGGQGVSDGADLSLLFQRTVMWLHPDSFCIGVLHAAEI